MSIKSIRDFILDGGLTAKDTIVLNTESFDQLVLEHRATYGESLAVPYLLLGVLIQEDTDRRIPTDRVGVIINDLNSVRHVPEDRNLEFYENEVAYRCGWCGNIVDNTGAILGGNLRQRKIKYIEEHPNPIVHHVHGACCAHEARAHK